MFALGSRDPESTTLYLDPFEARVIKAQVGRTRVARWLYHGLHSLDFPALYRHRGLLYCVIVGLMLLGISLSTTSMVIATKWVGRAWARR